MAANELLYLPVLEAAYRDGDPIKTKEYIV